VEFAAHPEYFAQDEDGTRDDGKQIHYRNLCYSNPEVAAIFVKAKLEEFAQARAENPDAQAGNPKPHLGFPPSGTTVYPGSKLMNGPVYKGAPA